MIRASKPCPAQPVGTQLTGAQHVGAQRSPKAATSNKSARESLCIGHRDAHQLPGWHEWIDSRLVEDAPRDEKPGVELHAHARSHAPSQRRMQARHHEIHERDTVMYHNDRWRAYTACIWPSGSATLGSPPNARKKSFRT
eukprot:scaffold143_cov260-Pinguiococcus_pyrenoidosus.AAC.35